MDTAKLNKRNIQPFDGTKYSIWKMRVRALLTEIKVIRVIDEDIPEILDDDWCDKDLIAKGVIIEYLSDSHLHFAKSECKAKDIFQSLDALYERKSVAAQISVKKRLFSLKLQGDVTLMKHFGIFDDLITELQAAGSKLDESDKVAHLLVTLPASYNGIITAIETLSEDNLTLAFVKTRLLDHEIKLKGDTDTTTKVLQIGPTEKFASKKSAYSSQNFHGASKRPFKGKFRGKFKKQNFKPNRTFSSNMRCHHCGRNNHLIKDCIFHKRAAQFNNDRQRNIQTVQTCYESTKDENASSFAFMVHSWESTENDAKLTFILDSGASAHIIKTDDAFINFVNIDPPLKISIAKKRGLHHCLQEGKHQRAEQCWV